MLNQLGNRYSGPYELIDVVRALAAMAVVFGHVRDQFLVGYIPSMGWAIHGFYFASAMAHDAVTVFFVISGYWITALVVRNSSAAAFTWAGYLVDRLSRLWIVLIPALLIGAMYDLFGRHFLAGPVYLGQRGTPIDFDIGETLGFVNAFASLTFLQTIIAPPLGSNAPLWSLANEFWYYIWFPTIYLYSTRRALGLPAILLTITTFIFFEQIRLPFIWWLAGSATFFLLNGFKYKLKMFKSAPGLSVIASSIIFGGVLIITHIAVVPARVYVIAFSFAIVLFIVLSSECKCPLLLRPLARYGGAASYSLYVVHYPLLMLAAAVLSPTRMQPSASAMGICIVVFAGLVLYGFAFSRLTEAHTGTLRDALRARLSLSRQAGVIYFVTAAIGRVTLNLVEYKQQSGPSRASLMMRLRTPGRPSAPVCRQSDAEATIQVRAAR